jgi:3D (Asp-Asp-Asp) domain-containing protein
MLTKAKAATQDAPLRLRGGADEADAPAFPIGSRLYVKRSNGEETIAFVKEYDASKNVYTLELDSAGSGKTKQCRENAMRAAPAEDAAAQEAAAAAAAGAAAAAAAEAAAAAAPAYPIGSRVYVKRSSGEDNLAFVK